jgi:hypothetical protein
MTTAVYDATGGLYYVGDVVRMYSLDGQRFCDLHTEYDEIESGLEYNQMQFFAENSDTEWGLQRHITTHRVPPADVKKVQHVGEPNAPETWSNLWPICTDGSCPLFLMVDAFRGVSGTRRIAARLVRLEATPSGEVNFVTEQPLRPRRELLGDYTVCLHGQWYTVRLTADTDE